MNVEIGEAPYTVMRCKTRSGDSVDTFRVRWNLCVAGVSVFPGLMNGKSGTGLNTNGTTEVKVGQA